jgi:hypothetical protein
MNEQPDDNLITGDGLLNKFFGDLDVLLPNNLELTAKLQELRTQGKFTDTRINQYLELIREGKTDEN